MVFTIKFEKKHSTTVCYDDTIIDGMMKDGLWDVYNDFGMGVFGELCAEQYSITIEEQDAYAIQSFERGIAVQNQAAFAWEIALVTISGGRGKPVATVDKDESLGKFDASKLRTLRPSFKKSGGTVTAGNASIISDGAATLVLVCGKKELELRLHVITRIRGLLMWRRHLSYFLLLQHLPYQSYFKFWLGGVSNCLL